MKSWKRWLYLIAALAAVFVAVASVAQAIIFGAAEAGRQPSMNSLTT